MNKDYKWKYDIKPAKAECFDCGALYGSFPDVVLDNVLWEKINPSYDKGGGILCPTCIAIRLGIIGIEKIELKIYGNGERIYGKRVE